MTSTIRRWVETDTGHRVPNHKSKCRHFHGHRYRWEAELTGDIIQSEGASDEGMVMDFSDVSALLNTYIHDVVDHAFVVFEKDFQAIQALEMLENEYEQGDGVEYKGYLAFKKSIINIRLRGL